MKETETWMKISMAVTVKDKVPKLKTMLLISVLAV